MKSIKLPSWTEALFGLRPIPAPPHAFALDRERIAYGGFTTAARAPQFREFHSEALPADTFQPGVLGGSLVQGGTFEETLTRLIGRLSGSVKEASLTLPDDWLRVAFAQIDDLPKRGEERDEVLRWKLKQLVPFPPDDLRIDGVEVPTLPGQLERRRVMVTFGLESVLRQIEAVFRSAGVRIGRIVNSSLPLLAAVDGTSLAGGSVICWVEPGGYSLLFTHDGQPLLHRYKALTAAAQRELIVRDLRLTRDFLETSVPGFEIERLLLCAPRATEESWDEWLSTGFDQPATRLNDRQLPPSLGLSPQLSAHDVVALLGAVREEVS
ncbi:MAG: hypothetical protein AAF481_18320 [Acidobacteriota bacterium]